MTSARGAKAALTRGVIPGHDADVYVLGLIIVAAIVDWLVHTIAASLTQAYIVPSLERVRREARSDSAGRDYTRGLALARFVGTVLEALAVFATCSFYAQNNMPVWPAWAVFAAFFATLHVPRLLAATASFAGFRRSAA